MNSTSIFETFDRILDGDKVQAKQVIVASPISREEVFSRIKPFLVEYLTNPKVLEKNHIDCVPVPEDNNDTKYFYFFEKTGKGNPSREQIEDFVFAVANLLGKTGLDEDNFYVKKDRGIVADFVKNGWAKIEEDSGNVLREARLENFLLLIRVADHDRQKLINDRDDAERSGSKRRIKRAQGKVDRFDARKSIAGKDKYFDVDDTRDEVPFLVNGCDTARLSGPARVVRDFVHNLRKLKGRDIYDARRLRLLVNNAFSAPANSVSKKSKNAYY